VSLLRERPLKDWQHPTVAGSWLVRDIVAHLADGALRRLSFDRDGATPAAPPDPLRADREFVNYINAMNAEWVAVARRFSPRVLIDLFAMASAAEADYFESVALEGPGRFGVSWAGEESSPMWFDVGREFTELWHHQAQIRLALGVPPLADPEYLRAVLGVAMRGLPHAYRHLPVKVGVTITVEAVGPSGGMWTLERDANRWTVWDGTDGQPATRIRVDEDLAWRLLFNLIPEKEVAEAIQIEGRVDFARPLLRARSVIV
jgi:uncharacterized protein (TIGR03083 family)